MTARSEGAEDIDVGVRCQLGRDWDKRITHYVYICVTNWIYVPERRASAQQGSKRCRCAVWRWRASLIVLTASLIEILKYQLFLQYMMERADFSEFLWCRCSVWRCRASLMSPTASPWKFSKISSLFSKLRGSKLKILQSVNWKCSKLALYSVNWGASWLLVFFLILKIINRKLWSNTEPTQANLILLIAIFYQWWHDFFFVHTSCGFQRWL